jgi:ATP-dependent Clp protease ATP-binding subunit ClpC
LFGRVNSLGYKIELTLAAKEFIAEKGYDSQFGARPLKRAIQKYLEDPIAEEILKGELTEGDTLMVDFDKEANEIKVVDKKKEAKP